MNRPSKSIKAANQRSLTEDERALTQQAFQKAFGTNPGLHFDSVRVVDGRFTRLQRKGYIIAPNGNIYWPGAAKDLAVGAASNASPRDRFVTSIFIHEMTHVLQYQQGVNVFWKGFFVQAAHHLRLFNTYRLPLGMSYHKLNIEQQAQFVRYTMFPSTVQTVSG